MKFLYAYLIALSFVLLPAPAQALECPAGQRVYTDYSTEFPTETCGPIENTTGVEPTRTYTSRSELSASCQQSTLAGNTINCSTSEKAFLSSLIRPPGIGSSNTCRNLGGSWNTNITDRDKCEFTPEQYKQSIDNIPVPKAGETTQTTSNTSTGGLSGTTNTNNFCKDGICTYTPLEPLCPPGSSSCQSGTTSFPIFLSTMFKILISVGGLLAVVMLVVAGIGYMLSESMVDIDKAKSRARAAIWGLLLLTSSWLILNAINPALLQFDINSIGTVRTGTDANAAPAGAQNSTAAAPQSNTISNLTLQGDLTSAENEQRWNAFVNECWYGNGGKPSQVGATLTCSR